MDNTFNYSLESKKVVARCNDSISNFVNLRPTTVLDITDENNNDVFSSNLITEHYKISTDNIVIFYNNIVEMSMVD